MKMKMRERMCQSTHMAIDTKANINIFHFSPFSCLLPSLLASFDSFMILFSETNIEGNTRRESEIVSSSLRQRQLQSEEEDQ